MNMTPNVPGTEAWAVKLQEPELKMLNLARQGALSKPWRRQHQGPTCIREQVNNWQRSVSTIDKEAFGSKTGPNWAWAGRPRTANLACFGSGSRRPLTYVLLYLLPLPPPAATSIQSSESHRDEGEAPGGSRRPPQVLELPRRWPRTCPSRHGWPCVVKPWWSSGAATWIRQVVCTFNIQWWYISIFVFTLIYYELFLFICVATICF
jgi:hypothetical protein